MRLECIWHDTYRHVGLGVQALDRVLLSARPEAERLAGALRGALPDCGDQPQLLPFADLAELCTVGGAGRVALAFCVRGKGEPLSDAYEEAVRTRGADRAAGGSGAGIGEAPGAVPISAP